MTARSRFTILRDFPWTTLISTPSIPKEEVRQHPYVHSYEEKLWKKHRTGHKKQLERIEQRRNQNRVSSVQCRSVHIETDLYR